MGAVVTAFTLWVTVVRRDQHRDRFPANFHAVYYRIRKGKYPVAASMSRNTTWGPGILYIQSTTGAALAVLLGVPYISMDRIMWQPGWVETPPEVFRKNLRAALDQDERGWVADGNYDRRGGLMAFEESTDVICQLIRSTFT